MIRLVLTLVASGTTFTMCNGGPVPEGCCTPPDKLNIILVGDQPANQTECDHMGGVLVGNICEGVDY